MHNAIYKAVNVSEGGRNRKKEEKSYERQINFEFADAFMSSL